MSEALYSPEVDNLGTFRGQSTIDDLDGETSVYAASPDFVREHCGPIACTILDAVPDRYFAKCTALGMLPNVDVRVHRLNIGEFPAVPGWHCDGALREGYFASPDISRVPVRDTVLATVSSHESGVSNFEILSGAHRFPSAGPDLWARIDQEIDAIDAPRWASVDGVLYQMGATTLHRCMPARVRGWRLLFRMSMWHNDYLGDQGKIARTQQVYIRDHRGW